MPRSRNVRRPNMACRRTVDCFYCNPPISSFTPVHNTHGIPPTVPARPESPYSDSVYPLIDDEFPRRARSESIDQPESFELELTDEIASEHDRNSTGMDNRVQSEAIEADSDDPESIEQSESSEPESIQGSDSECDYSSIETDNKDHPESSDSDSDSLPSSLVSIDRAEISDCDTTGHPEPRSEPDVAYTVIGYRNRTTVGIADNLDDGQWLVRIPEVKQSFWETHANLYTPCRPGVEGFKRTLQSMNRAASLSISVSYVSSVEDVIMHEIVAENTTHYEVTILGLTDAFIKEAVHPCFSKNIGKTFALHFNRNSGYQYMDVPKHQLKYFYPKEVTAWEATCVRSRQKIGFLSSLPPQFAFTVNILAVRLTPELLEIRNGFQARDRLNRCEQLKKNWVRKHQMHFCDLQRGITATSGPCCPSTQTE